jgi:cation diffusion facilitator family transporter
MPQRKPNNLLYREVTAAAVLGLVVNLILGAVKLTAGLASGSYALIAQSPPPGWVLWIAGANVLIKEALYQYKSRVGKRTGSQAIVANAWDHRSDALCSLAVLVGLTAVYWGGEEYAWADEVAALVVVAAIVSTGIALFVRSVHELLDAQAGDPLVEKIHAAALAVAGVENIETLRVRKSGLEYFVDIHIEVDSHLTVAKGHRISHRVKDQLLEQFQQLRDVLVHVEPFPQHAERPQESPGRSAS